MAWLNRFYFLIFFVFVAFASSISAGNAPSKSEESCVHQLRQFDGNWISGEGTLDTNAPLGLQVRIDPDGKSGTVFLSWNHSSQSWVAIGNVNGKPKIIKYWPWWTVLGIRQKSQSFLNDSNDQLTIRQREAFTLFGLPILRARAVDYVFALQRRPDGSLSNVLNYQNYSSARARRVNGGNPRVYASYYKPEASQDADEVTTARANPSILDAVLQLSELMSDYPGVHAWDVAKAQDVPIKSPDIEPNLEIVVIFVTSQDLIQKYNLPFKFGKFFVGYQVAPQASMRSAGED